MVVKRKSAGKRRPMVQRARLIQGDTKPFSRVMAPIDGAPATDGRHQRAVRTRERILDAMMKIVATTGAQPTVAAVAARARINIRSVFVHFPDIEALIRAGSAHFRQRHMAFVEAISSDLPLAQRLDQYVAHRAGYFASMRGIWRVGWVLSQSFTKVAVNRAAYRAADRARLGEIFAPELARQGQAAAARTLAVLGALIDWHFWEALVEGQNLSHADATAHLRLAMAAALVGGDRA